MTVRVYLPTTLRELAGFVAAGEVPEHVEKVVAELPEGTGPVPLDDVVAVHADTEDRPAGADPDEDLGWFASQEIEQLISD